MHKPLVFILFYFFAFTAYPQSGFQIQKDKSKVVIPFKLINNLVFVSIKLNGEALTFLLDTGVEETILFSVNDDSELSLNQVEVIKLKGLGNSDAIKGYKSSNNLLAIKDFVDSNHSLFIVLDQEFNFSSQVGIPVNGILGYHFFKNHLVEIDYTRQKIYVFDKGHKVNKTLSRNYKKDSISLELNKPYIFENISNQGKTNNSKLLLDSGNSDAVWVFNNEKVKIPMAATYIDDFLGRGFNGDVFGKRSRIDSIKFGGHLFKEALTNFPDLVSTQGVSFVDHRVGSIGGEILSRFTIFIDYPNKVIYTKPNATVNEPFNFNMSGIEVEHAGLDWVVNDNQSISKGINVFSGSSSGSSNEFSVKQQNNLLKTHFNLIPVFKVLSVRPNSEAALAGLQKGDRIISINNQKAERFTIQKIHELLKSEEGRTIQMRINRNDVEMKIKFQLKKVI